MHLFRTHPGRARLAAGAALLAVTGVVAVIPWAAVPPTVTAAAPPPAAFRGSGGDCRGLTRGPRATFDASTRRDAAFNHTFEHGFAEVDGVQMHYVTGGEGPVLVLLHGWPQSWYEFYDVMPGLAEDFTVVAVDLPGLGDSQGEPPSYDKVTLARYVHGLVSDRLGHDTGVHLAAHDLGAGVAFQYAAQYSDEVARMTVMDYPLPGPVLDADALADLSWHFAFHEVPELPEQLVRGDQRTYLDWFYDTFAASPDRIPDRAVREFVRVYCRDQVLRGGFELYRTLGQDTTDNLATTPLPMPVQVLSAGAGEATLPDGFGFVWQPLVQQPVVNIKVPDSGHWLPEENPAFVIDRLRSFHLAQN